MGGAVCLARFCATDGNSADPNQRFALLAKTFPSLISQDYKAGRSVPLLDYVKLEKRENRSSFVPPVIMYLILLDIS